MPFHIGQSINSTADTLLKSDKLNKLAENPVYTALVIVVIVMLTIVVVFRNSENDDSLFVMALRTGFWVFLGSVAVIFAHDRILHRDNEPDFKDLFKESNLIGEEYTPVVIPTVDTTYTLDTSDTTNLSSNALNDD